MPGEENSNVQGHLLGEAKMVHRERIANPFNQPPKKGALAGLRGGTRRPMMLGPGIPSPRGRL